MPGKTYAAKTPRSFAPNSSGIVRQLLYLYIYGRRVRFAYLVHPLSIFGHVPASLIKPRTRRTLLALTTVHLSRRWRHAHRTPGAQLGHGRCQVRRGARLSLHAPAPFHRAGGRLVFQQQRQTGLPMDTRPETVEHRRVPSPSQSRLQGVRRQRDHAQVTYDGRSNSSLIVIKAPRKQPTVFRGSGHVSVHDFVVFAVETRPCQISRQYSGKPFTARQFGQTRRSVNTSS